jgi:hypothetical protein
MPRSSRPVPWAATPCGLLPTAVVSTTPTVEDPLIARFRARWLVLKVLLARRDVKVEARVALDYSFDGQSVFTQRQH